MFVINTKIHTRARVNKIVLALGFLIIVVLNDYLCAISVNLRIKRDFAYQELSSLVGKF